MAVPLNSGRFFSIPPINGRRIYRVTAVVVAASAEEKVKLGGSELKVTRLGIGAWSWGDNIYWNSLDWDDRKLKATKAAFNASVDHGVTFFDTAEIYGASYTLGAVESETLLGRLGRRSVICVLKDSLARLGLASVDLYQLHWSVPVDSSKQLLFTTYIAFDSLYWLVLALFLRPGIWGNEGYIDGLGDAVELGLRLREAHEKLKKRGIPLSFKPKENGVTAACDELGITLIAYSPIGQGVLSGKYTPTNPPTGLRGQIYTPQFLTKLEPLLNRIRDIGQNYNKTSTQ
ncbi:putative oxidoreductase, chloroplastic, partial [Cucurbita argyrosperma subsp. argyrosperma]